MVVAGVVEPAGGQDPLAGDDAVAAVQLAEPSELAGRGVHIGRTDPGAGGVERGLGVEHPGRSEQALIEEGPHAGLAAAHEVAEDPADDVRRAGRVVPDGPRRMVERQRGGVRRVVGGAGAEQHVDGIGRRTVDVVLDEPQPGAHLQQVEPVIAALSVPAHAATGPDRPGRAGRRRRGCQQRRGPSTSPCSTRSGASRP